MGVDTGVGNATVSLPPMTSAVVPSSEMRVPSERNMSAAFPSGGSAEPAWRRDEEEEGGYNVVLAIDTPLPLGRMTRGSWFFGREVVMGVFEDGCSSC